MTASLPPRTSAAPHVSMRRTSAALDVSVARRRHHRQKAGEKGVHHGRLVAVHASAAKDVREYPIPRMVTVERTRPRTRWPSATSREPLPAARRLRVLERDAARPGERRTVAGGRASCTRGGSPWACAMDSRRSRREHSLAARGRRARARPARAAAVRTSSGRPASPLLDLRSHRGR